MRLINDNDILKLLGKGKSQSEIARALKVSPTAIHKRLKRLTPTAEKLTPKQKKFALLVGKGQSRISACMEAFNVKDRASAKALQNNLCSKDEMKISIREYQQIYGHKRSYRIQKLNSLIDHPDPIISLRALETSFKLDGLFKDAENQQPEATFINIRVCAGAAERTSLTGQNEKISNGDIIN